MKLKITLFLTALPYLAVARADIGIVPRPLSAAEGRGTFAITERTGRRIARNAAAGKIRFRNRAVTYRNPCFVPADREEAPRAVRDSPASQAGPNCDTGRPESAPSDENRLPNPPARTLRTNRSRSRFYFLSLAVKTTSLSAAGQERPVPHHAAALKTVTRHGQSEPRPDIAAPPRGAGQLRRRVGLAHPARRRHRPHLLPRGEIVPASGDTCPATHQRPDPDDVGRPSVRRQSPARRLPPDSARPPISAAAAGLRRRPLAAETAAQRLLDLPHRS